MDANCLRILIVIFALAASANAQNITGTILIPVTASAEIISATR
jgi:hypothetical protein